MNFKYIFSVSYKKHSLIMSLAFFTFTGCVDADFASIYHGDNFYKSQSDAELALVGAYASLRNASNFVVLAAYSDNSFSSKSGQPAVVGANQHASTTNTVQEAWNSGYSAINRCNEILKYIPGIKFDDANKKEQYLAEAHFLRAKYYFELVRLYGENDDTQLPYQIEPTENKEQAYAETRSVQQIYELIIEDLEYAGGKAENGKDRLPIFQNVKSEIGRATKGASQALLANVHLTRQNWEQAIQYANDVINSGQYRLISYDKLFNIDYEREAYNEVIFGIQHVVNASMKEQGSSYAHEFCPQGINIDGSPLTGKNNVNNVGQGYGAILFQNWFIRFFEEDRSSLGYCATNDVEGTVITGADEFIFYKDYRIERSFFRYYMTGDVVKPNMIQACYPVPEAPANKYHVSLKKYIDPKGIDKNCNGNDFFMIRFSEMYLILAEAYNELGDYAKATKAIDVVRQRARMADGQTQREWPKDFSADSPYFMGRTLSQDEFRWAIFMERGLEFVGEGKRFYDMKRMKYGGMPIYDYMKNNYLPNIAAENALFINEKSTVLAERKKYLPIPKIELDRNTNPNLKQNSGY